MLVLKRTIQKLWSFFRSSMFVGTSRFIIYLMGIDLSWRIPVHYSWLESTRRKLSIDYSRVKSILFLALLTSLASGIYISPNWLLMARSTNPTDRKVWQEKRSCAVDWLIVYCFRSRLRGFVDSHGDPSECRIWTSNSNLHNGPLNGAKSNLAARDIFVMFQTSEFSWAISVS